MSCCIFASILATAWKGKKTPHSRDLLGLILRHSHQSTSLCSFAQHQSNNIPRFCGSQNKSGIGCSPGPFFPPQYKRKKRSGYAPETMQAHSYSHRSYKAQIFDEGYIDKFDEFPCSNSLIFSLSNFFHLVTDVSRKLAN